MLLSSDEADDEVDAVEERSGPNVMSGRVPTAAVCGDVFEEGPIGSVDEGCPDGFVEGVEVLL